MKVILAFVSLLSFTSLLAQRVENTSSYRNIGAEKYVRINYENDFFAKTDQYYTQGINLEFVFPKLEKFPAAKLLFRNENLPMRVGIALEMIGFTPTDIRATGILTGDRPYASTLMLKNFSIVSNPYTNHRLVTQFCLGVIGPWSGGKEIQIAIHERINPDKVPLGWKNQIRNDIILNYQVEYEHGLWVRKFFILTGKGGLRAGTLSTKINGGFSAMAGLLDNPFKLANTRERNFQVYIYAEPQANLVIYDATMQGGLFNDNSPYTLGRDQISRIVFQQNAGLIIKFKGIGLEYSQSIISKEFKDSAIHSWGSVRASVAF